MDNVNVTLLLEDARAGGPGADERLWEAVAGWTGARTFGLPEGAVSRRGMVACPDRRLGGRARSLPVMMMRPWTADDPRRRAI